MTHEEQPPRKDRLIQTRVPRQLESTLKQEARRQRLTVSHLIRNMLEESFQLVDGVVADANKIVSDSVNLARTVSRGAVRVAAASRNEELPGTTDGADLDHVYAWNEVVLHKAASCSRCGAEIARGEIGYAGLSDAPSRPRAWLCGGCIESL